MLKYISVMCDSLKDGEKRINREAEELKKSGYRALNAGVNTLVPVAAYRNEAWVVMIKD